MSQYVLPILFTLFVWWFSTGVILYLDGLPRADVRWSMAGATVVLAGALYGLRASSARHHVSAARTSPSRRACWCGAGSR